MQNCIACHGKHFEEKALGKSKIVKDMSKEEIIKAIKGYQNGTYGRSFKELMKANVANLTNSDIEKIASKIKGGY